MSMRSRHLFFTFKAALIVTTIFLSIYGWKWVQLSGWQFAWVITVTQANSTESLYLMAKCDDEFG
jgi:hypothetical protein